MDTQTLIPVGIFILVVIIIALNWKRISSYLDKETARIDDLNHSSGEIEYFVSKYRAYDSQTLIEMLRLNEELTSETRAIRKVLAERNMPF